MAYTRSFSCSDTDVKYIHKAEQLADKLEQTPIQGRHKQSSFSNYIMHLIKTDAERNETTSNSKPAADVVKQTADSLNLHSIVTTISSGTTVEQQEEQQQQPQQTPPTVTIDRLCEPLILLDEQLASTTNG